MFHSPLGRRFYWLTFCSRPLKLVNLARSAKAFMNVHVEQTPLEDIVSDDGRVVLVGDAAHAMVVSGLLKIKPGELY